MVELANLALHLIPAALTSAVHVVAKAVEGSNPPLLPGIMTETVSSLATDSITKGAAFFKKGQKDWSSVNTDLDRVVTDTLLTILSETLASSDLGSRAADVLKQAANAWELRIFSASDLIQDQLISLLRTPAALDTEGANEIAGQMLAPINEQGIRDAYAAAIEQRFAGTFEVLLRRDERAFRAATILLNRKSFLELAAIRSDLAALAETLKKQPVLRRFEELAKATSDVQPTDFQFKRRATGYRIRDDKEKLLMEWLLARQPFGIAKLTGPAGMGKSRLALRICDWCHSEHWLAGFLEVDGKFDWERWTPILDTLIVVDYVGSKSIADQPAFRWLESLFLRLGNSKQQASGSSFRVRVILIDRTDTGTFWTDWNQSEVARDLDRIVLPVPLDPDREEFDALVQSELRRRLRRDPFPDEEKAVKAMSNRLNGQFRPLFALLAAAAIADPDIPSSQAWSQELLTESILKAQLRQWRNAGITDDELDLLFEATLTQGACCESAGFAARLDRLLPGVMHTLRALSDSSFRLGAIVPDLMGEFFVLMRMRGEATSGTRQVETIQARSSEILEAAWKFEPTADFAALLLDDYLAWKPAKGINPAEGIASQALAQVQAGKDSWGLQACCFQIAWKRTDFCDWLGWVHSVPGERLKQIRIAVCAGLHNATVGEPDAARRLRIADRIELLHRDFGQEPAVREQLAKALYNATVGEPDAARCLRIADRIELLHRDFGQEPAVRERLAKALYNATVGEPDAARRLRIADRIELLHRDFGQEPAVREALAKALYNATVVEPDAARSLAIADRIELLESDFGKLPPVQEWLRSIRAVTE